MKTVWNRLSEAMENTNQSSMAGAAILMIIFFLTFGAASLYILLNSPA